MKEQEIIAGNKLIAEFMEIILSESKWEEGTDYWWENTPPGQTWGFQDPPPFDQSWSWLMPVVEKIESLGYDARIHGLKTTEGLLQICEITDWKGNTCGFHGGVSKIVSAWWALVQFIQWYNSVLQSNNEEGKQ